MSDGNKLTEDEEAAVTFLFRHMYNIGGIAALAELEPDQQAKFYAVAEFNAMSQLKRYLHID
jgi:hypothetical protein